MSMSYFHKTLFKLYKKSNAEERTVLIEQHIDQLKAEFENEERLRELLNEYYAQLERIKVMLKRGGSGEENPDIKVEGDPVLAEIIRAHDQILEIEKLISQIYGETHKFLE